MLRIRVPSGFLEIAEEAETEGTFDESLAAILRLLQKAARERDARRTHLLTVSLHAFLRYKGGNHPLPKHSDRRDAPEPAAEGPPETQPPPPRQPQSQRDEPPQHQA